MADSIYQFGTSPRKVEPEIKKKNQKGRLIKKWNLIISEEIWGECLRNLNCSSVKCIISTGGTNFTG